MGEFDVAIDGLRDCLPHASRLDDMELVLRCYTNLGFALGTAGRNEEAAAVAAEGVAACRRFGPASSVSSALVYNQIGMLIVLGRWAEADHLAQEALDDAPASSDAASLHQLMVCA